MRAKMIGEVRTLKHKFCIKYTSTTTWRSCHAFKNCGKCSISISIDWSISLKPMADGPSFSYEKLVRETCIQETCIQVAQRTIQVSRTRNMADDTDDDLAAATHYITTDVI